MELHKYEVIILKTMEPGKKYGISVGDQTSLNIEKLSGLNSDAVKRAVGWLKEKGLVKIETRIKRDITTITEEYKQYKNQGFPEYNLTKKAMDNKELDINALTPIEKSVGLPWAKRKNWITIKNGKIVPIISSLPESYEPDKDEIKDRKLIFIKQTSSLTFSLSNFGEKIRNEIILGKIEYGGINLLTDQIIKSKSWKNKPFRKYNVTAESEPLYPGKRHILSRLSHTIREIFKDMGFQEMEGPVLESSFWVFDALFQPQDHPARELADTFYIKKNFEINDNDIPKDVLNKVKKSHEKGWGYRWSEDVSKQGVLRCHTTSLSAKMLSKLKDTKDPKKYFAIGKVYRNEAIDYKHLAEFHQVEGIIVSEDMKFSDLLGTLKEFYKKLGFDEVKFFPCYFPYTEPSVEIYVYLPSRKEWVEMGGAGIFRPEVSETLCGRYPVLAFGLSLERPLMILTEMDDIRMFYQNKIDWLRKMTYDQVR
ncbi:phenylalanine--tRNA ligase subunit alpha [Candidatus Micrarchaeota archaeon]|nr:phenylalanine--tRNA ligase subunit alpha [Candidatus Micrarchaeota archaeon]